MSGRYLGELACPRCKTRLGERDSLFGCPRCVTEGIGSNLQPVYTAVTADDLEPDKTQPGLFRWRNLLPLDPTATVTSIGEGNTPLLTFEALAKDLGVGAIHLKDETRNPTWSYKDRLASVAVSKAVEMGGDTVIVSTTGNHGAAVAAYAAAAGIRCVVLTLASVPTTMRTLMQAYGAEVVSVEHSADRWTLMAEAVEAFGWIPMSNFQDPPVGSNPFGVEGYKTIAYELATQMEEVPDVVVIPTAYGDGLAGVWRGFADLHEAGLVDKTPRMVAAEPLGPYQQTLATGLDRTVRVQMVPSVAFSTAGHVATHQGLWAVRQSDGWARSTPNDDTIIEAQLHLARSTGIYVEAATAVALDTVAQLVGEELIGAGDSVVVVATSTGLKDPAPTTQRLPSVPTIQPTLDALVQHLDSGP